MSHSTYKVALIIPFTVNDITFIMRALNRIEHETLRKSITVIMVYDGPPLPKKLLKEIRNEVILLRFNRRLGPALAYAIGIRYAIRKKFNVIILADADALPLSKNMVSLLSYFAYKYRVVLLPININLKLLGVSEFQGMPFHFLTIPLSIVKVLGEPDWKMIRCGDNTEYQLRIRTLGFKIIHLKSLKYIHPVFKPSLTALFYSARNLAYLRLKSLKRRLIYKVRATRLPFFIFTALALTPTRYLGYGLTFLMLALTWMRMGFIGYIDSIDYININYHEIPVRVKDIKEKFFEYKKIKRILINPINIKQLCASILNPSKRILCWLEYRDEASLSLNCFTKSLKHILTMTFNVILSLPFILFILLIFYTVSGFHHIFLTLKHEH